jgi:multisubunit Na+/H+ antiporter MnhG subunit
MLAMRTWEAVIVASLVITLQIVASPVGSHLLARSIYHQLRPELDGPDELAERLEADEASPSAGGS